MHGTSTTVDFGVDCVLSCTWYAFIMESGQGEWRDTPRAVRKCLVVGGHQRRPASDELLEIPWHNVGYFLLSIWPHILELTRLRVIEIAGREKSGSVPLNKFPCNPSTSGQNPRLKAINRSSTTKAQLI